MLPTKFMLFAIVALMVVGSTFAIIGGKDATRGQFPYFAYLESYKIAEKPVIIQTKIIFMCHKKNSTKNPKKIY